MTPYIALVGDKLFLARLAEAAGAARSPMANGTPAGCTASWARGWGAI